MKILFTLIVLVFYCKDLSAQIINYDYDNLGRLIQANYPDSSTVNYTYDASGNRLSSITKNNCFTNPSPTITIKGNVAFCLGDSVVLTSSKSDNYLWSTGEKTQEIVVKESGIYTVNVLYSSCAKSSDFVTINVSPRPKAQIIKDGNDLLCSGDFVTLKAETSNSSTYKWSTGATSSSIVAKETGVYKLYVSNSNGCVDSTSTSLTFNPLPVSSVGADKSICEFSQVGVQIGSPSVAGYTYTWSPSTWLSDITSANPVANPTSTTSYTLKVTTAQGCSTNYNPVTVKVNPRPKAIINTTGKTVLCDGDSVILKAQSLSAYSYKWSTGATSSSIIAKKTGDYKLYVTNAMGCTDSTSTSITFNSPLNALAGIDKVLCDCPDSQIQIGLPPVAGNIYSWSPAIGLSNPTIANPIANPLTTTTYTLKVINSSECTGSSKVTISKVPTPIVDAGKKIAIIAGTSATIGASPTANGNNPFSFRWSPSNGLNNPSLSNPIASPDSTTTYKVYVTDKFGCVDSSSVYVAVIPKTNKIIAYPNPTNDKINIIGADVENGRWNLSITTSSGSTILKNMQIQATNRSLFYEYSIKGYATTTYLLIFEKDNFRQIIRIIKSD